MALVVLLNSNTDIIIYKQVIYKEQMFILETWAAAVLVWKHNPSNQYLVNVTV